MRKRWFSWRAGLAFVLFAGGLYSLFVVANSLLFHRRDTSVYYTAIVLLLAVGLLSVRTARRLGKRR